MFSIHAFDSNAKIGSQNKSPIINLELSAAPALIPNSTQQQNIEPQIESIPQELPVEKVFTPPIEEKLIKTVPVKKIVKNIPKIAKRISEEIKPPDAPKNSELNNQIQTTENKVSDVPKNIGGQPINSSSPEFSLNEYGDKLLSIIKSHKRYPALAKRRNTEGTCKCEVKIKQNGELASVTLISSSGSDILDSEALDLFKRAAPYPPSGREIKIVIPIVFKLN